MGGSEANQLQVQVIMAPVHVSPMKFTRPSRVEAFGSRSFCHCTEENGQALGSLGIVANTPGHGHPGLPAGDPHLRRPPHVACRVPVGEFLNYPPPTGRQLAGWNKGSSWTPPPWAGGVRLKKFPGSGPPRWSPPSPCPPPDGRGALREPRTRHFTGGVRAKSAQNRHPIPLDSDSIHAPNPHPDWARQHTARKAYGTAHES